MLRKWSALALILWLCLAIVPSRALDQLTWAQQCAYKLSRDVATYAVTQGADGSPVVAESGMLAAGTPVAPGEYDPATQLQQVHTSQSAVALIRDQGAIVSATRQVSFDDGTHLQLSEALVNDRAALLRILRQMFPGRTITAIPGSDTLHIEYPDQPPAELPVPQESGGQDAPPPLDQEPQGAAAGPARQIIPVRPEPQGVEIRHLGFVMSTALVDGEWRQVPTGELKLAGGAPDVAAIYAPKIGKCRLRMKPQNDGAIVNYCQAGSIVQVLERGKRFSKVIYENMVGYVRNDCLFAPEDLSQARPGELTYKGNARVRTTINLRHEASGKSLRVAEMPTGTRLQIIEIRDGWAMVEANGVLGYVMETFVQPVKEEGPQAGK